MSSVQSGGGGGRLTRPPSGPRVRTGVGSRPGPGTVPAGRVRDDSGKVTTTPVKRRRLLPLVDLRGPSGMASSSVELGGSPACLSGTGHPGKGPPSLGVCSTSSLGVGRRSRAPLTDLDARFITKSGLCGGLDGAECAAAARLSASGVKISHVAPSSAAGGASTRDDAIPRFPRLDQCAHFHYEYVELPAIQVILVSEDLKPLSQLAAAEDTENKSLLVQVSSLGRSWVVRRTYENFRFLDKQLHRCCYDRKISQLPELPPEENVKGHDKETAVEHLLRSYLSRLSAVAGSLITCGPVLSWMELDNRGHRLIVTDDSDINTPAVAAAYVVKRYTAQASDEISFEVGDMISVIDMPPPEESIWWRGKRGFQVGFFPCECVQVIGDKVPQSIHPHVLTLPSSRCAITITPTTTTVTTTATITSTTTSSTLPGQGHFLLHRTSSIGSAQEPLKPVLRKHGKLIAFFRSFILSRPSRRKLKQSGILRERVFGCDLGENLMNSGHDIPMVLRCCSEFIETHGTVDGIYRLSGITSNIQKLRNAFDEERVPDLYGDGSILQDIHCVSSVLKMYFRELPNPLLTYQLYGKFAAAVMQDEDLRLLHVRDVVQQLPPPHYRTLEYLVRHLARIAAHSSNTGMTPKNIAIVWAPNLLRSKDLEKGGVAALQDVGTQAVVTEYLVRYVDLIFNDKIPNFSPSITEAEITQKTRPKSLAISTPTKLISIDEARKRALAALKTDQNYIEVGGGPQSLPKTYHTVIDFPSRKGGSLKQKKSPSGWKTLFSKNRHQRKSSTTSESPLNVSDSAVMSSEAPPPPSKILRPVKSVESLVSTPLSLHSNSNAAQASQHPVERQKKPELRPLDLLEREGSISDSSSSLPSPRTHNRSISHDSYFNVLERSSNNASQAGTVREERESDIEFSPDSPKVSLGLSELNMEFNTSEPEMRIFSEDETLQSTSFDDTLSRSPIDVENVSLGSDYIRSKDSLSSRDRRSLKDKLKHTFSSPQKRCAADNASNEGSRNNSLKRASNVIKDKIVYALSPETARKKDTALSVSPTRSPKSKHIKVLQSKDVRTDEPPLLSPVSGDSSGSIPRQSVEGSLIEPDLLEKITHMRISPAASASDVSSVSFAEATASDNESFTFNSSSSGAVAAEASGNLRDALVTPPSTCPITIIADVQERVSTTSDMVRSCEDALLRKNEDRESKPAICHRDRPSSLLGLPTSDVMSLGSSLVSPDTPQGDSTFLEIQYDPLSDTTEPSTPSETQFGTHPADLDDNHHIQNSTKHSTPLSPDISSSSGDDPIDNAPMYENIEMGMSLPFTKRLLDGDESTNFDSLSSGSKPSPEAETPTAADSEYENIKYHTLEYDSNSKNVVSETTTPCYENVEAEFVPQPLQNLVEASHGTGVPEIFENVSVDNTLKGVYEQYSFSDSNEYENIEFPTETTQVDKTAAEIEGEIVYQQVKYLKQTIKEVNGILREDNQQFAGGEMECDIVVTSSPIKEQNGLQSSDLIILDHIERQQSDGSECLESPVTPSSSSIITEVMVLPSFSSPTESTTEDATSTDDSESHASPQLLSSPNSSKVSSTVASIPSPTTFPHLLPSLSPPSPDSLSPVPSPSFSPNRPNSISPIWPKLAPKPLKYPVPKPRNLPILIPVSPLVSPSSSNPSISPDSPASPGTPSDSSINDSPREGHSPPASLSSHLNIQSSNVPCEGDESSLEKMSSQGSPCPNTCPEVPQNTADGVDPSSVASESLPAPEGDSQKRERINKIKEERRTYLRKKFPSDSFKGEKDDMIFRLKQKATSPSRQQDDEIESPCVLEVTEVSPFSKTPVSNPDPERTTANQSPELSDLSTKQKKNEKDVCSDNSARFHASDFAHSKNIFDKMIDSPSNNNSSLKDPPILFHRSISEEPKTNIFKKEVKTADAKRSTSTNERPLGSEFHGVVSLQKEPKKESNSIRSSKKSKEDDINVKERVAIWSRHEETAKKGSSEKKVSESPHPPPPPVVVKHDKPPVPSSRNTSEPLPERNRKAPTVARLHSVPTPAEKPVVISSYAKIGKLHSPIKTDVEFTPFIKQNLRSSPTEPESKVKHLIKSAPQSPKRVSPVLTTQKSQTDLRSNFPLKTSRSYSVGTPYSLGVGKTAPVPLTTQQKKIKDIAARFEKESFNNAAFCKPVLRQSSKD